MSGGSRRLALATVLVEGLLGRLTFGMVSFALPLYAYAVGLPLSQIGVLISLRTVFVLVFKPVAGWLADRVGVRAVYLGGIGARTLAAALLLVAGDFLSLAAVRILQGASAAGRDVASLSLIARDAPGRVGTYYGWYATAKHVGSVLGAGAAGLAIAAAGGGYRPLFLLVFAMSLAPFVLAWFGIRDLPDESSSAPTDEAPPVDGRSLPGRLRETVRATFQGLTGAASVGMLVATSAYMVHGIFPLLATQYAGLSTGQAGLIYMISAAVFMLAGPAFGLLVDRGGRPLAIALRSACNVCSSALYVAFPSFGGLTAARVVDDTGKAAFRPAWGSLVAEIAATDARRRGRRLGALDTAATAGETLGPALAGVLWQTGGVVVLFSVRILIAVVAELAAFRVFGELRDLSLPRGLTRLRRSSTVQPANADASVGGTCPATRVPSPPATQSGWKPSLYYVPRNGGPRAGAVGHQLCRARREPATMHVLLIEDDARIREIVERGLGVRGFVVSSASDPDTGLELASKLDVDLVLLDLVLPRKGGLELLQELRAAKPRLPVIALTALDDARSKVAGLESGVDDYVTKPFAIEELAARIRARLRWQEEATDVLKAGPLTVDLAAHRVIVEQREVTVSARELSLLAAFVRHPGQVLTRTQLLQLVWDLDFDPGSNVVDVYVAALRRKIGAAFIETVRRHGYRFVVPQPAISQENET